LLLASLYLTLTSTNTYDKNGNILTTTDPNGKVAEALWPLQPDGMLLYKTLPIKEIIMRKMKTIFFIIAVVILLVVILMLIIRNTVRVEDIALLTIKKVDVLNDYISIVGQIKEDNTSIWSYKNFRYTIEDKNIYFTICSYPEYGKLIFSHLDFVLNVEGDFSNIENVYLKDNEKAVIIWKR